MKVLIAVASKHGSTREIAASILRELRNCSIEADLKDVKEIHDLEPYDAIIFGSAVYAGNWLPEAKLFAEEFHGRLSKVPVWVFSSGPLGSIDPQPKIDMAKLAAPLEGIELRDHHVFVGNLDHAELSLSERLLVKMVGAPYGDNRDWDDVRDWAWGIAQALHVKTPTL